MMDNAVVKLLQSVSSANNAPGDGSSPFRPPQWGSGSVDQQQLVYMRPNVAEVINGQDGGQLIGYFFDAVIRTEHSTILRITEHPIQSGANKSDHAYMLPVSLTMEIGVSDAMDEIVSGQFSDNSSKSVSAYQVLKRLQRNRLPLQVMTRLELYQNMLIEHITTIDDSKTASALKAIVSFKQIVIANVTLTKVSVRPQVTNKTNKGAVQPSPQLGSALSELEKLVGSH
jgi:hypothetical protein